jgi:hypothetical protein
MATRAAGRDAGKTTRHLVQSFGEDRFRDAAQKTVQRSVVGHGVQTQGAAQFAMLAQPHLDLAKGPVFESHQAQQGQQLRLGELVFAETSSIRGQDSGRYLESQTGERHETYLGHSHLLPLEKTTISPSWHPRISRLC